MVFMIYITQLIYIHKGQEHAFHQFEDIAIPLIEKYNGKLLLRLRPSVGQLRRPHTDRLQMLLFRS